MKAVFAPFLVILLIVAALQADAKPMNLRWRRLANASMRRKAIAGSTDATVSSASAAATTSSKTTGSLSTTSTSFTPTTATTTGNPSAKPGPQREKNDGYNNYSSDPPSSRSESSHHFFPGP
ncbi:hypothetical protein BT93_L1141 [Corymbia citriodora subsp. variegata]|uniref:Uncharacterized protein n=1 Tax=Corymbia citriodora subsp. variegata TaxID=360336 RepID=A0A8T0CZF3_CORYI|nr:hypothetical protein BT93_L1141 [Corymbia citriodora subsp. variegata]